MGTCLAWDWAERFPGRPCVLVGRSAPVLPVRLETDSGVWEVPAEWFCTGQRLQSVSACFVCVHAHDVAAAGHEVARLLRSGHLPAGTPVVFLNNGLLPDSTLAELQNVPVLRALVHVGSTRTQTAEGTRVRLNGGDLIEVGSLTAAAQVSPDWGRHFRWVWCEDIRKRERAKFFVNLVLALHGGDGERTNGEILAALEGAPLLTLARHGASVLGHGLTAGDLVSAFRDTASATAHNVNSVSLARSRGDRRSWDCLRECARELARAAGSGPAAKFFADILF